MRGPDSSIFEITDPVEAAKRWLTRAVECREVTRQAREAAAACWDRGDYRGCETAIRQAEDALRWCEAAAAFLEAWYVHLWAGTFADVECYLSDSLDVGQLAEEGVGLVELCREDLCDCLRVRRVTVAAPECSGESLCAGAVVE